MTGREDVGAVLREIVPEDRLGRDVPLGAMTTFRIGGPADWLVEVVSESELRAVLVAATDCRVPVTVLGGGSNVVIADAGLRGVVIRPRFTGIEQLTPYVVRAGSGVRLNGLVRWTIGRGLSGLEAWAGTPGTVGGAIHGNAHFRGEDIGDLVKRVCLVTRDGELVQVGRDGMEFAYDTSRLQRTSEIAVWAELAFASGDPVALRQVARASLAYRKSTQPLAAPSAGCVFQNPDPARDHLPADMPASAGALIDRAGLKGSRIGGALISTSHANFIVNDGTATAEDVRALVNKARTVVRERFGVTLRDEVVFLGLS